MLEARSLACLRDDKVLFNPLSFSVSTGEFVHITGRNGAGKTSLLRLLAGLSAPDSGEVLWNTLPLSQVNPQWHRELCWIGHHSGVKGALTVDENLMFWCMHARRKARQEAIDAVNLTGWEETPASRLSAGQQRRVALARLWLTPARFWLLDEPFTALDASGINTLTQHLEKHIAQGGSVVMTSHQSVLTTRTPVRTLQLMPFCGELS